VDFSPAALFSRVARWFILRPKIPIWRALKWKMLVYFTARWYNVWPIGIIYGSWYSLWSCGILFPFWYVWMKENLATLLFSRQVVQTKQSEVGAYKCPWAWTPEVASTQCCLRCFGVGGGVAKLFNFFSCFFSCLRLHCCFQGGQMSLW
jgi:hypothetical protein